eukprot:3592296-Amphidinium_carterae.1
MQAQTLACELTRVTRHCIWQLGCLALQTYKSESAAMSIHKGGLEHGKVVVASTSEGSLLCCLALADVVLSKNVDVVAYDGQGWMRAVHRPVGFSPVWQVGSAVIVQLILASDAVDLEDWMGCACQRFISSHIACSLIHQRSFSSGIHIAQQP